MGNYFATRKNNIANKIYSVRGTKQKQINAFIKLWCLP